MEYPLSWPQRPHQGFQDDMKPRDGEAQNGEDAKTWMELAQKHTYECLWK